MSPANGNHPGIVKQANGRWRVRWRDPQGVEQGKRFDRLPDAKRFLDGIKGDAARGTYLDPAGARTLFGEYAEAWREMQVHRPSTQAQVESHFRLHVVSAFGNRQLGAVRTSEVQAWVKELSVRLSPATVEVAYRYLAAVFKAAVADRLIGISPCAGVKLPRVERRQVVPLATEQVFALADTIGERHRALVLAVAGTGLRQGEAFGLTVDRIDFLRRQVRVDRQLITLPRQAPTFATPKTSASVRTVPLPGSVVDVLAEHLRVVGTGESDLMFTASDGKPSQRNRFGELWRRAIDRADLPVGTRFHDLRHFYASLLIRHGESVKVVQARLGHASAAETLDTYSHLWPDSDDRTREAIDTVLGRDAARMRPTADVEAR